MAKPSLELSAIEVSMEELNSEREALAPYEY